MKRTHGHISQTPACLLKRGKTAGRLDGMLGTPVEGLTNVSAADTPESDDRPNRAIPETTQRRLEGFCLNTPLSLSQAAEAETPTLAKDGAADAQQQQQPELPQQHGGQQLREQQEQENHAAYVEQQHLEQKQEQPAPEQQQQQDAQVAVAAALPPPGQGRHRLANISNLQPTPQPGWPAKRDGGSSTGPRPMLTGDGATLPAAAAAAGARPKRRHHVMFQPDLLSPPTSLPRSASGGSMQRTPHSAAAAAGTPAAGAAAAAAGAGSSTWSLLGTPSSCGRDEDELGFVLHTSQTYVRHSQPAISPSVAAGLSAQAEEEEEEEEEEEPFTTPSQDSREPRLSPSNATSLATTTVTTSFELPQLPAVAAAAAAAAGAAAAGAGAADAASGAVAGEAAAGCSASSGEDLEGSQQLAQQQQHQPHGRRGSVGGGSNTPADGLGVLHRLMEETTTPELEQVGVSLASQEPGGSQPSGPDGAGGAAAAAAAAAAGGSSGAAAAAAPATGSCGTRGALRGSGRSTRAGGVVCEEVTTKQVLFPIFRPKSQRKCVILVRHGESTYNKQDTHGRGWADPQIFDAPLTGRGRQQALATRDKVLEQLGRHGHLGATLWLSSPLSRAIETMLLAAPQVEALAAVGGGRAGSQPEHKVMVLSLIAEHCATSGDVGRPASQLATQFPALAAQLAELPEQWWFNPHPEDSPNCAVQGVFNKVETVELMRRRVSEFSRWLHARPEQLVVAFGHSTFWKYFANTKQRLRNCEVLQMWW